MEGSTIGAGAAAAALGSVAAQSSDASLSKARIAYNFISRRIASGEYAPGFRLVLGQIARELGISPVPVREAVRMLEAEGSVTYERNIGAQVAMLDPEVYSHTMETLGLVEGYATAISAPLITPDELAEARSINEQLAAALDHFDPVAFTRLNTKFHECLFRNCPNPHISDLVGRGWQRLAHLRESTFGFVPGRAAESVAEHGRILELIERGASAAEIEQAARSHRLNTLHAFLDYTASKRAAAGLAGADRTTRSPLTAVALATAAEERLPQQPTARTTDRPAEGMPR